MDQIKPPHVENMREVFLRTLDELAKPYPAVELHGWNHFNKYIGGFRTREFSILCGPTGKGKTTFLANISAQLVTQNVKHFVMSIETGETDYMKRILSIWEEEDLNTGLAVSKQKLSAISAKYLPLMQRGVIEFSLYDSRIPIEQLKADITAMVAKGCRIVFIDNLNYLLKVTRSQDVIQEMDRVVHDLIEFVKRNEVHIVMVMHPKKTENGRVESEFDIKGSSTAVQEAQNVFLFNPPYPQDVKSGNAKWTDRELKIAKLRRRGVHTGKSLIFENYHGLYREAGYREPRL